MILKIYTGSQRELLAWVYVCMYLVIGEQSVALGSKEVVVPDTQHAHHHGNLIKNTHTHTMQYHVLI